MYIATKHTHHKIHQESWDMVTPRVVLLVKNMMLARPCHCQVFWNEMLKRYIGILSTGSTQVQAARQPKFGSLKGRGSKVMSWKPRCFPLKPRRKLNIILASWWQLIVQHRRECCHKLCFPHPFKWHMLKSFSQNSWGLQEAEDWRSCADKKWDDARANSSHDILGDNPSGPQQSCAFLFKKMFRALGRMLLRDNLCEHQVPQHPWSEGPLFCDLVFGKWNKLFM